MYVCMYVLQIYSWHGPWGDFPLPLAEFFLLLTSLTAHQLSRHNSLHPGKFLKLSNEDVGIDTDNRGSWRCRSELCIIGRGGRNR